MKTIRDKQTQILFTLRGLASLAIISKPLMHDRPRGFRDARKKGAMTWVPRESSERAMQRNARM